VTILARRDSSVCGLGAGLQAMDQIIGCWERGNLDSDPTVTADSGRMTGKSEQARTPPKVPAWRYTTATPLMMTNTVKAMTASGGSAEPTYSRSQWNLLHQARDQLMPELYTRIQKKFLVLDLSHNRKLAASVRRIKLSFGAQRFCTRSARWPPNAWIVLVPATTSPLCGVPRGITYSFPAST